MNLSATGAAPTPAGGDLSVGRHDAIENYVLRRFECRHMTKKFNRNWLLGTILVGLLPRGREEWNPTFSTGIAMDVIGCAFDGRD
jgi:hypothetical protein